MSEGEYRVDVAVLGGGPAGIAAACVAAERGQRVLLLEGTPWLGGPIWCAGPARAVPRRARTWLKRLERSGADVWNESVGFAASNRQLLEVERRQKLVPVRWQQLILATGAQELFLPFSGWTLPGVTGVGGLQLLSKSGWPLRGRRVVVAGTGPLLHAVAAHLTRQGTRVSDLLEQAAAGQVARFVLRLPWLAPGRLVQAAGYQRSLLHVRYRTGCWLLEAHGTHRLEAITFTNGIRTWTRECDILASAFGLVPSLQWPLLLGCQIAGGATVVDRRQQTSVPNVYAVGEATGLGGVDMALIEGQIAGMAVSGDQQGVARLARRRRRAKRFARALREAFSLRSELKTIVRDDTVVCRCEDVTWQQVKHLGDVRSAKLQTRCGMGACQGRICHTALNFLKGWPLDKVRPPLSPVRVATLGALAADHDDRAETIPVGNEP